MADELLVAQGVRVEIGSLTVELDELRVEAGEVLAVLGPNGAGKTTLLQALARIRRAQGSIWHAGEPSYLPQRPVLFSGSVARNAALPLRLRGVRRPEAMVRAGAALAAFGIEGLASRPARTLSGGEARRAALARAIVADPDLLFLDEPFGGLDAPTRERLLGEVGASVRDVLRDGAPRGVLLVTHDREEVVAIADRVLIVVDGGVEQQGRVEDVFARPSSERAATLVGAENVLFGAVVAADADTLRVRVGEVALEAIGDVSVGDEAVCTLRPEAIVLYAEEPPPGMSARNRLRGTVVRLERRPHLVRVVLDVRDLRLVATVAPSTVDDLDLHAGSEVGVGAKATSIHATRRARR